MNKVQIKHHPWKWRKNNECWYQHSLFCSIFMVY